MKLLLWLCMVACTAMVTAAAMSQQSLPRVALVIGNASYPGAAAPLPTTISDVRALTAELLRHEFTVNVRENVDKQEMQDAIDAFLAKVRDGTVALFYFSGFGIQLERQSFLIPTNAGLGADVPRKRELDGLLARHEPQRRKSEDRDH